MENWKLSLTGQVIKVSSFFLRHTVTNLTLLTSWPPNSGIPLSGLQSRDVLVVMLSWTRSSTDSEMGIYGCVVVSKVRWNWDTFPCCTSSKSLSAETNTNKSLVNLSAALSAANRASALMGLENMIGLNGANHIFNTVVFAFHLQLTLRFGLLFLVV